MTRYEVRNLSIKDVHLIFIVACILVTVGFGVWAMNFYAQTHAAGYGITGIGAFGISVGLAIYAVMFLKKTRGIKA